MAKIQVILGSTRPTSKIGQVGDWIADVAKTSSANSYEIINLGDWQLPFLDEPIIPSKGQYSHPHTKKWSAKILEAQGYILVTPEYNHSFSAVLKNALDFLYKEWHKKPVALVSYSNGGFGGARAVEQLRLVVNHLDMVALPDAVHISHLQDSFDSTPHTEHLQSVIKELDWWTAKLAD